MTTASQSRQSPTTYRIDAPCALAGFDAPPFDVHLMALPAPDGGWTLLVHSAPGKPKVLARWLGDQVAIQEVRIAPGLAPKVFRATLRVLPPVWAALATLVKVHHLDLGADRQAAWFVEGIRSEVWAAAQHLDSRSIGPGAGARQVRCRPVGGRHGAALLSRRQFEALSAAVSMGYYEIPHRIDLRTLAAATGVSLGSVSELLRRAEGVILTHYVDTNLMDWPLTETDEPRPLQSLVERADLLARPLAPPVRLLPPTIGPETAPKPVRPTVRGPPR
ncbi:MAG TPA: helix-turn-helix domain-containing protein [Candidatus Thermoplasmatota archaeon]|nr:helix-turn-helix domain-containing protein [Candidatus Thermoplasmatota archaeon]